MKQRNSPTPNFAQCLKLMRQKDAQVQEDGFHSLLPRAGEFLDELMREFAIETRHGLKCWLLELIGAASDPRAYTFLTEQIDSDDESFAWWAEEGLKGLNTKESRTFLYNRSRQKRTDAGTPNEA